MTQKQKEPKEKLPLKERIIRFLRWIWEQCKDWHTVVLLIFVIIVMYFPVWGGYMLYGMFGWGWCAAAASAYMLFWAGPFTPFFPLCIFITLSLKKLLGGRKKCTESVGEAEGTEKNDTKNK